MHYELILCMLLCAALMAAILVRGDVGIVITAMVVGVALVFMILKAKADEPLLEEALSRRLAVWRVPKTGALVYVRHCAQVKGGCRERASALASIFEDTGKRYGLDPYLLAAMAFKESGMSPGAHGSVGERGVLQIHPRSKYSRGLRFIHSEAYRKKCLRRPDGCQKEVIDRAALLLSRALARCGDLRSALGMYQSGQCDRERPYVQRVLREKEHLLLLLESHGLEPAEAHGPATKDRALSSSYRARRDALSRAQTNGAMLLRAF